MVGQSSAGLLPGISLGGFPQTEPTPAKTWADRMGQGVRGPGPSEESEKRSQEDARLLRPVADTRGQGGAAGMAPEEGAAQTQPGGRTKSGRGGRLLAPACGVGPWGHRSGRGEPRAPAAPRRGREGGHSPAWGARRLLPAARAPAQAAARPLCAWRVTRGRSRRRARERPPAPRAPFQAQQRPRRGPALTHFPSRLLDPRLRIQRPPPSRCEPSGGARGRRRGWAPEPPRAPHHSLPGRARFPGRGPRGGGGGRHGGGTGGRGPGAVGRAEEGGKEGREMREKERRGAGKEEGKERWEEEGRCGREGGGGGGGKPHPCLFPGPWPAGEEMLKWAKCTSAPRPKGSRLRPHGPRPSQPFLPGFWASPVAGRRFPMEPGPSPKFSPLEACALSDESTCSPKDRAYLADVWPQNLEEQAG